MPLFPLAVLLFALSLSPVSRALATALDNPQLRAGEALYAEHCARCHQTLSHTTKAQRSASRIRSANRQFPAMTTLDRLSDAELEAIAAALRTISL